MEAGKVDTVTTPAGVTGGLAHLSAEPGQAADQNLAAFAAEHTSWIVALHCVAGPVLRSSRCALTDNQRQSRRRLGRRINVGFEESVVGHAAVSRT
jgi:hypothetical protein